MPFFFVLEIIMKYCFLLSAFIISACSSLGRYQEQPVVDLGNNIFKTTCNGIAEGWDSCFRKAQKTCGSGFSVTDKTQLNDFVHREITFKCR